MVAQLQLPPFLEGIDPNILIGGGAAFAVLLLALILSLARRKKPQALPPVQPQAQQQQLPQELPKVTLPPSELEAQKRAEAEQARHAAEEARRERQRLQQEHADKEKLAQLKAQEEQAKKAAYQAEKAAEAEAKERKKREAEEAVRLEQERLQKAKEEEERRRKEQEELERQRVAAQAGQTLAQGLARTRNEGFIGKLNGLFGSSPRAIDEKVLGELEEVLFTADIGVKTAAALVETAREKAKRNELGSADAIKGVIRKEVARIVDLKANHALQGGGPPHVIMVVGVNGSGKTTTIGKLAAKATAQGKKVVLAAGDTFRAAAAEQLDVWAERAKAELVKGKDEADPASVVFDAVKKANELKADLVIADTAGRLHTKANLMEELKKVRRVIDKAQPGAPHEVLLVLDSTNGQNAIAQARQFHDAVGVTSIALTKLDGTAKGGVIIGICDELKVPVAWAGVGEKVQDLRPFEPKEFVEALFD